MKILESLRAATTALLANKMRSALTMLGVIIGVGFVILLVALGSGARGAIVSQIEGMGSNMIMIAPFEFDLSGGISSMQQQGMGAFMGASNNLTSKHIDLLRKELDDESVVNPLISKSAPLNFGKEQFPTMLMGSGTQLLTARGLEVDKGRFFTEADVESGNMVVVLGPTVVERLFGDIDPIGKYITIKGRRVKVIGTYKPKGTMMMMDQDTFVYMPDTTAGRVFSTSKPDYIVVNASSADEVEETVVDVKRILDQTLTKEDYTVITQIEALSFSKTMLQILTYLLGGMASISLVVGGIGIMNIMLVSVTERTREIGIRKAVGAKTKDIMIQFLVESMTISLIGGIIGILIAATGTIGYNIILKMPATITPSIVFLAFLFASMVGIFFGVYPARKASLLDPIESLRYE